MRCRTHQYEEVAPDCTSFTLERRLSPERRTQQIRDIRIGVAFDTLDVMSSKASGVLSRDASVLVSSRICVMRAR